MEGEKTQTEGAPSEDHSQQQQQEGGDATEPTPAKEEDLDLQMEQITNLPPEDQKRVSLEMLKLIRDLKDQKDELLKKADNLERNQESVKKQYEEETKKIENRLLEIVKNGSPEGESEGLVAETKESLKKITEGDHEDFDRLRARNQVFGQLLKNSDTFAAENERLKLELEASKKEPNRLETILQGFDSYRGNRYSPYDRFPKDQAKGAERVRIMLSFFLILLFQPTDRSVLFPLSHPPTPTGRPIHGLWFYPRINKHYRDPPAI